MAVGENSSCGGKNLFLPVTNSLLCVKKIYRQVSPMGTVMSGQTKTWSDAMIILLVHKITGYGTINKIHILQKYKLIMWLTDLELAGLTIIYPLLIARGKDLES